jgi:hypothetical protein
VTIGSDDLAAGTRIKQIVEVVEDRAREPKLIKLLKVRTSPDGRSTRTIGSDDLAAGTRIKQIVEVVEDRAREPKLIKLLKVRTSPDGRSARTIWQQGPESNRSSRWWRIELGNQS